MGTKPKGGKLHRYVCDVCQHYFAFSDNIQYIIKDAGTPTSVSDIETGRSKLIVYYFCYNLPSNL